MISQNIPIDRLDEHVIKQFLGGHLLHCDCPKPVVLALGDLRAGCNHLLEMFRDQGAGLSSRAP